MTPLRQELEDLINRYYPQEQRLEDLRRYQEAVAHIASQEGRSKVCVGMDYLIDRCKTAEEVDHKLCQYLATSLGIWDEGVRVTEERLGHKLGEDGTERAPRARFS